MSEGIYSRGKQLLEEERQKPVPPTVVMETLKPADLTEKAKAVQSILETLQPLVDAKLQQTTQLTVLRKAIGDFNGVLAEMLQKLEVLTVQLSVLEQTRSENAELERTVLKKLNGLL